MTKLITMIAVIMFAMMFCIAGMSEAQNMDKNQALSSKQQAIIPIAAFTAKGNLEKLKVSLITARQQGRER